MSETQISEAELHAHVDGALSAARSAEIETYLARHPEDAARVAAYREQLAALRREFNSVLDEPLPRRLQVPRGSWMRWLPRVAAVMAWITLGGVIGWQLHAYNSTSARSEGSAWARRAAIAHVVYSPEVRHPVEVGADQEAHLVAWLSKRLGTQLKVPHLGSLGYSLVGGRLLPGERGPVAQFMYQDGKLQRLTLYVRINPDERSESAFLFAQEQGVGVFYWLDRKLGYALSGKVDKAELLRVATAIHGQLNP
jgi:anti-sigma factor RsiW